MRIKEKEDIYRAIRACFGCNLCSGMTYDERCPLQFIHGGIHSTSRGLVEAMRNVIEGKISLSKEVAEYVYTDPLCGNCATACDAYISMAKVLRTFRADLVDAGFAPLPQHVPLIQGMKNYSNPWGLPRTQRGSWAKGIPMKDATKEPVDVLYYVGCTAASDRNLRDVCRSTAQILNTAGLNVGILGSNEECCGTIAYQVGDWSYFEMQGKKNLESINKTGAKVIVTACAGCSKILKNVYPDFGIGKTEGEVLHLTELIERLLEQGKIKPVRECRTAVTYHDPCHLGRECGEYGRFKGTFDAPRNVIKALPGVELIEMERIRENSWCCGAGGGLKSAYPDAANKVVSERVREAERTGADMIISACPFCENHIRDGLKAADSSMKIRDIAELVVEVV